MRSTLCLAFVAMVAARTTCPKGMFMEDNTCQNCLAGQYNHLFDSGSCFECPAGKYANEEGALSCEECPVGYYSDDDGYSTCTACDIGQYGAHAAAAHARDCHRCPAGKFGQKAPVDIDYRDAMGDAKYKMGAPVCTTCPDGKYSKFHGKTSCEVCGYPTYSRMGSTICSKCERGTFLDTARRIPVCKSCDANDKDPTLCPHCEPGKYQVYQFAEFMRLVTDKDGAHTEQTKAGECYKCPHGQFANKVGAEICEYCPAGYHSNGEGTACSCIAKDCKLSEWGGWTDCSRSCGKGRQTRTRTIVQSPNTCFDAKQCGHTVQQQSCNEQDCPVEPTAAPTKPEPKARTDLESVGEHKMRETDAWTSTCSHVYCTKAKRGHIVHHKNMEKHGTKHLCAMHMHQPNKCGCECTNAHLGNPFATLHK